MQAAVGKDRDKAKDRSSLTRITTTTTDHLDTCRPCPVAKDKHKSNLGKPVAAGPLLVQAVVQEPLADGLSDFD